ncbi:MAG: nitroreductase family protein [Ilumatobacteraceae bacterium]
MDAATETLYSLLSTTRSIRRIDDRPVPDDVLERVLQAAVWAPSGGNRQPWRVVVVRDRALKQSLADLYVDEWADYVDYNLAKVPDQSPETLERVRRQFDTGGALAAGLAEVPVVCVFVHDPSMLYVTDSGLGRHPVVGGASLYPAVQNLLLAARGEGLGGVITTLLCRREPEIREVLSLPEPWAVHAVVPLGWPKGRHGPLRRAPLTDMVSWDRWQF